MREPVQSLDPDLCLARVALLAAETARAAPESSTQSLTVSESPFRAELEQ